MAENIYIPRGQNEQKVTEELREKIKSKMDVAKFFSGFIPLFLGLAFKEMVASLTSKSDELVFWAAWVGILFILSAFAFSIATMFALDRLLMPPELWKIKPEQSFNQTLKDEMVCAWRRLFYPAVIFFLAGVTAFLVALTNNIILPVFILLIVMGFAWCLYRSLKIRDQITG
jgi:hypothetical protein